MIVYAIELIPGHCEIGVTDNLASVVDRVRNEVSSTRPRRIYTDDLSEAQASEALRRLEAVAQEHGYRATSGPSAGPNRWCVDMIALHTFYRRLVPCQMFGANPWDSYGNKLPGVPEREWVPSIL